MAYLLLFCFVLVWVRYVDRGLPAQAVGWDTVTSVGKEVKRRCSAGSTGDMSREEGRLQLMICCSLAMRKRDRVWRTARV